jgi:hypothetical protein
MKAEVDRVRKACDELQKKLEAGAVDEVERHIEETRSTSHESLLTLLKEWRQEMLDKLASLPVSAPPLLPLYGEARQAERKACLDALTAMPDAEAADLEHLLQGVTDLSKRLYRFLEGLVLDLGATVHRVAFILGGGTMVRSAQQVIEELGKGRGSWKPEVLLHALHEQSARLHDALGGAVLAAAPADQHDRLTKLLSQGHYAEAAAAAVGTPGTSKSPISEAAATVKGKPQAESPGGFLGLWLETPAEYSAGETTVIIRETSPIMTPPSAATIRTQARDALLRAKRWNTAVAAVLAVGVGYLVFADSFVGSPQNIAAAFIWAFGVDTSVDVILETAKKKLGLAP